jgi:ERCC4-type nuclease
MSEQRRAQVIADVHERQCGIPQALENLGVEVTIERLRAGDYAIKSNVLVERKSVLDLHGSIESDRFWIQIVKLKHASRFPFLLIEGEDIDAGPLSPKAIRGACIAVIHRGIRMLRTTDQADSAFWLERLAVRAAKYKPIDRPRYAQGRRPAPNEASEAMLAAVPGISVESARALLRHFGSVANVVNAEPAAWEEVRGIGPTRASALGAAFAHAGPTQTAAEGRRHS